MNIFKNNYQAPDLSLLNADVSGILCASPETTSSIYSYGDIVEGDNNFPGGWD